MGPLSLCSNAFLGVFRSIPKTCEIRQISFYFLKLEGVWWGEGKKKEAEIEFTYQSKRIGA